MDWSRAKTILIAAFLLLNVVLGYQLWTSKSSQLQLAADTTGMVEDTKRLLRQHNIQFPDSIPTETPKLKGITVKFDEALTTDSKVRLQTHFKLNPLLSRSQYRDISARSEIRRMGEYQYDQVASSDGVYVFNQLYNATYPMFDVRLELYEEGGEIVAYRQAYAEMDNGSGGDQKEQRVLPAYTALRSLVENHPLDGATITNIQLGYHGQLFNSQPQYMVPTWRVTIAGGGVYYIHGFNGAVEGPQGEQGATDAANAAKKDQTGNK
ncbi:two-component system regulatory protein YycI [Gordoniibacillus kamchatkensis]|uniref:two-component system regulatory protein YycI n=1 Tax=Gordoniibacillus kamchatkensis TaxID=1590651 RepID=UPI0009E548A4|nr:two-component system regulatory protein YycI [Paenibacillus sp. VKM B-2647]